MFVLIQLQCLLMVLCVSAGPLLQQTVSNKPATRPVVIAHRGASGILPEHTLPAYQRAIEDKADFIECDVTLSADHFPICLHESTLSTTTDVASHSEFAGRKFTLNYTDTNGQQQSVSDWFSFNFTLLELKTLHKIQAMNFRDQSFNGQYTIPTLQECIDLVQSANRSVGIYPEIKEPALTNMILFNDTEHGFEDIVLQVLASSNYVNASDNCIIQSFSEPCLDYLVNKTQLRLVLLIELGASNSTLDSWSYKFHGLGVWTDVIAQYYTVTNGYKNWIGNKTTDFVARAHARQLQVHVWTLRNEDRYLAWDFEQDIILSYNLFLDQGVDGFFTDFPRSLTSYLDQVYTEQCSINSTGKQCSIMFPLLVTLTALALSTSLIHI